MNGMTHSTRTAAPIRVMIVEDSPSVTALLRAIIDGDPRLEVAAAVESGEKALEIIEQVKPDIISMDIRLPGINGLMVTQRIMATIPTPIVVVSASIESEDMKISMNALRAGALSVVEKPVGVSHEDFEGIAHNLCNQLVIMSEIKVVKQRFSRNVDFSFGSAGKAEPVPLELLQSKTPPSIPLTTPFKMVAIGASTGGPNALLEILGGLPPDFSLPVLIVQHITLDFLEGFISWLNSLCPLPVVMVTGDEYPRGGTVYIARPDHHLVVRKGLISAVPGTPVCRQRPSVTVMFNSIAQYYRQSAIGVLLTGMGEDGAEGLKSIKDAGGYTIAEDKSTAVVYGMPGAAVQLGAVHQSLPVKDIAPRLIELVAMSQTLNRPMNGTPKNEVLDG